MITGVAALFWLSIEHFAINFPFYDDFDNIVNFVPRYTEANGLIDKWKLLFEQNFEHRVLFAKLLTLLIFKITGLVNIKWLIIVGDLSLVGISYLIFIFLRQRKLSLLAFFSAMCLVFQVQHYEDSISWATCSLQHAPCLCFSFWSFYLAINRRNIYLSGSLALLALFTSANGLGSVVIWIAIVSFTSVSWKKLILPVAILVSISALHMLTLTIHSGPLLKHATSHIGAKFLILISFAGQTADTNFTGDMAPSVVLGSVFLFPLVIVAIKVFRKRQSEISQVQWLCITGIAALSFVGFLIAFTRGLEPDFYGYRLDRYKIYAAFYAVFAIIFYDSYWNLFSKAILIRFLLALVSFTFCLSSYYLYYGKIRHSVEMTTANRINAVWNNTIYYPLISVYAPAGKFFQHNATRYMLLNKEALDATLNEIRWSMIMDSTNIQRFEDEHIITLSGRYPELGTSQEYGELCVVATSQDGKKAKYFFIVECEYKKSVKLFYTTFQRPMEQNFKCLILKDKIEKGDYNLYILATKGGQMIDIRKLGTLTKG